MRLADRISRAERIVTSFMPLRRCHRIIVDHETREHARARHEATHGPIADADAIIWYILVSPARNPAMVP